MNLLFLCVKIFMARILDVSIGTVRTLIMVKGKLFITTILAFLEALIWVLVVKEALITEISSFLVPISYSLGYATGTFLGSYICNNFINAMRKHGFAVSIIDLENNRNVLLICQVNHKDEQKLLRLVKKYDKNAFIVVSDTKYVQNGFIK